MHATRVALLIGALSTILAGCPGTNDSPAPVPDTMRTTSPPATAHTYAENTSAETRDAHRQAVAQLRAGQFQEACDTLDAVPQSERRALTEYLTVLCMTRIPASALSADVHGDRAIHPDVPPALLESELISLRRHRAWIAGVQDDLGREAASSVLGFTPPLLPPELIHSHDLSRLAAWAQRGTNVDHDATTYNRVRTALQTKDLATRLAVSNLINRPAQEGPGDPLNLGTVHTLLFADVTGMTLPALPAMSLPSDDQL